MNDLRNVSTLAAILGVALMSGPVRADRVDLDQEEVRALQKQGAILSLEQILVKARQRHDGHVLEAELEKKADRYLYEIEMLDADGQVWEMKFDAASGEFIEEDRED